MSSKTITFPLRDYPAWIDLLLFKGSWAALVLFQTQALVPVLGVLALKILSWPEIYKFIPIIAFTFITGITMDSLLALSGVYIFPAGFLPLWLVLLWVSFALTLPRGFLFVSRWHPLAQSGIGIVAGCAGYLAGYLLNAVTFGFSLALTMGLIAILWAVFVPLVFKLNAVFLNKAVLQ